MGTPPDYKIAIFLLPVDSSKRLSDVGWEFSSTTNMPRTTVMELIGKLGLSATKEFLGIEVYANLDVQANVEKNDEGSIEFVYFQCRNSFFAKLKEMLSSMPNCEVFIPSEYRRDENQ